jgi:hypothetical protein
MNFQERFPEDDDIWMYSNPREAQEKAFKIYGKNAILYRSKAKNKKYSIVNPKGKIVNFGQIGFEDFTKHKDASRRHNYLTRTANMKGNWKNDGYSANNLSRNILW